jgi:hypothetical protein
LYSPPHELLSRTIARIKGSSSLRINRLLNRKGTLWERESFDHIVRTTLHLYRFNNYVEMNPVVANLVDNPEKWPFSSAADPDSVDSASRVSHPNEKPWKELTFRGDLPHLHKEGCTYFVTFRLFDAVTVQ